MARPKPEIVILKPEHYDQIQEQLERNKCLPDEIKKAEAFGINCEQYKEILAISEAKLKEALRIYFPKGRPR